MSSSEEKPAEAAVTPEEPRKKGLFERLTGPWFSPHGLLSFAVVLAVIFMVMHLAGMREYTTIISGTSPSGDPRDMTGVRIGVFYILFYMLFTMIAPVLVIAAGLLSLGFALPAGSRKEEDAD